MIGRKVFLCFLPILFGFRLFAAQLGVLIVPEAPGLRITRVFEGALAYGVLREGDLLLSVSIANAETVESVRPYIGAPLFLDQAEGGERIAMWRAAFGSPRESSSGRPP